MVRLVSALVIALSLVGCASGGVHNNLGGSTPVNNVERYDYLVEVRRCFRTGGTRIVKVEGVLRCF